MSWYDDDDSPRDIGLLAGIIEKIYERNGRFFNRDVEVWDGRKYIQAAIHLMTAFGLHIGYGYKWNGYPYSSGATSGYLSVYSDYTKKMRKAPELEIHKDVRKSFNRYMDFIEEAGDDSDYLMELSGIAFVANVYGFKDEDRIRKTLANGMKLYRFDDAFALCRKYGIVE